MQYVKNVKITNTELNKTIFGLVMNALMKVTSAMDWIKKDAKEDMKEKMENVPNVLMIVNLNTIEWKKYGPVLMIEWF